MQLSAKAAPVCSVANRVFMNGLYAFIYTFLLIYLGEKSFILHQQLVKYAYGGGDGEVISLKG